MADLDKEPDTRDEDEEIVREAKERFARCEEWESHARDLFLEDLKFVNADSDNGYQWPNQLLQARVLDKKPCLTINKTRQHCLLIVNDAKQNKPSVTVHPVSDDASYQAAQVFEDLIRHIEYQSQAQTAYDTATEFQVQAGIGYVRVVTDYADTNSFDQDIYIRRVADPLTVYMDPDAKEADKSDGRFAFVYDDMPRELFKAKYPDFEDVADDPVISPGGWLGENHVRVAEYWRKSEQRDKLVSMVVPETGQREFVRKSKIPKELWKRIKDSPDTKVRDIIDDRIEVYKIAGNEIIERKEWAGCYIPIVPIIGEETVIEGQMDRKGHVRALKDPQRQYNYYSSAATEAVALQSKTPYVGPVEAFESLEQYWANANRENFAFLPYNGYDDKGQQLAPPQRQPPAVMPDAMLKGLEVSQNEMMMVSGQYQAMMGEASNEKSGKAINERQRQGDRATYHYIDNLATGIRQIGRILIDLIPKIYDTERVVKIRAQDGAVKSVKVDPSSKVPVQEQQTQQAQQAQQDTEQASIIFNPSVGKYAVETDIGPNYATKRQEAWNAISQILIQNQTLTPVIGDLLFKNADFPGADDIAERLKRLVPPNAMGQGPSPDAQQAMQQAQQAQAIIGDLTHKLKEAELRLVGKDQMRDIEAFDAETKRIKELGNAQSNLGPALAPLIHQMVQDALAMHLQPVVAASQAQMAGDMPQMPEQGSPDMGQMPQPPQQ